MRVARRARHVRALLVWLVPFVIAGCGPDVKDSGDDGGSGNGGPHTLLSIEVTPTNPIVEIDLGATGTQDFTVTGYYEDATTDDVTAQATWTVANPAVGSMNGATLDIPASTTAQAVTSLITANVGGFIGQAQITVVALRLSGSDTDFFFVLPYEDAAGSQSKPLDFSTNIPQLDVFFLMDTTESMGGEISNLQTSLNNTVIKQIQLAIPNTEFGVGALEDFPVNPYGATGSDGTLDQPFKLRQAITNNSSAVLSAVNGLSTGGEPIGNGNDIPEAGIEAIYQVATGNGLGGPGSTNVPVNHSGVGGVGFRADTMPVVVDISDAVTHGPGEAQVCGNGSEAYAGAVATASHSRATTKTALSNICARVVGIAAIAGAGSTCDAQAYLTDFATTTGALVPPAAWDVGTRPAGCSETQCCIGKNGAGMAPTGGLCPLVFRVGTDGGGVGASVATGIEMLTRFAQFDVTDETEGSDTDTMGNVLPMPHTTADFIKSITPVSFTLPTAPPVVPAPAIGATDFTGVTPGTVVAFDVVAFNDFIPQTDQPQIFTATIHVLAGGCTPLDARTVLILVPPMPIGISSVHRPTYPVAPAPLSAH